MALVSEDGLESHKLRKTRLNNDILAEVRELGEALPTIIAETRWLTLRLTRKEHAEGAGIDDHAQMNVEGRGINPQHETYASIHKFWKQMGIGRDTLDKLIALLLQREHENQGEKISDDEPLTLSTFDLYRKWGYVVGMSNFEHTSKQVVGGEGLTYGGLWQRRAAGMVPDFWEVNMLAGALEMDREEARAVWASERMGQLLSRKVPEPCARFFIKVEASMTERFTALPIAEQLDIPQELGKKLSRCEFVPFSEIGPVARRLFRGKELRQLQEAWQAVEAERAGTETYGQAFERIRDARGITNAQIVAILNIRPPEERIDGYDSSRNEPYRPSHVIRDVYQNIQFSHQAPAGVLNALVARPRVHVDARDMAEPEYLRELFLETRNERRRTSGSSLEDSTLRLLRDYWGIDPDTLESETGIPREEILLAERRLGSLDGNDIRKLERAAEKLGRAKVEAAFAQRKAIREEQTRLPLTVEEFAPLLAEQSGGYLPLSRKTKCSEERLGVTPAQMKRIGVGPEKVVPPLPELKYIAKSAGTAVGDTLIHDWYAEFPTYLAEREKRPMPDPLARLVWTAVSYHSRSGQRFCDDRLGGLSNSLLIRHVQALNAGTYPTWEVVSRYLSGADIGVDDPPYVFAEFLYQRQGNTRGLIKQWVAYARERRMDPTHESHRFGLTKKELEQLRQLCPKKP